MNTADIYLQAADDFADLVAGIPEDSWTKPGLGVWDVRSLTGHASRALVTVIAYLDKPASAETITSPENYYLAAKSIANADEAAIVQRGRDAGQALGDRPTAAVSKLTQDVRTKLGALEGDPIIETIGGGMRVSNYLPTRTFELAVHSLDLAFATGVSFELSNAVATAALDLATRIASAMGDGTTVLRALTGRATLADRYSVV